MDRRYEGFDPEDDSLDRDVEGDDIIWEDDPEDDIEELESTHTYEVIVGYRGSKRFLVDATSVENAEAMAEDILDLETFDPDDIQMDIKEFKS